MTIVDVATGGSPDMSSLMPMRQALDKAKERAGDDDLTGVLACVHRMHSVVYAATGNPEFERIISSIAPRFDRVIYLWYTDSISDVGRSYRRDLVAALEAGRRDDAVELMRDAWARFRDAITERKDHVT